MTWDERCAMHKSIQNLCIPIGGMHKRCAYRMKYIQLEALDA